MLKSLNLRDFQVHEDLKMDFSPGITTIVGPTDAGKSSVLRALRWLCLNYVQGSAFVRNGAGIARIRLLLDGRKIIRVKGKGKNSYILDGKKLVSFGTGVPEPVDKLLAVNEINFQRQHDDPFWFGESAGEISRQLNRVIDLSVIDSSLSNAARTVRECKDRVATSEERLREKRIKLKESKAGMRRVEMFRVLDAARVQLEALGDQERDLFLICERMKSLAKVADPPDFSPVQKIWDRLNAADQEVRSLTLLLLRYHNRKDLIAKAEMEGREAEERLKKTTCPLCGRKND